MWIFWEVLNGVGVDEIGGIFLLFYFSSLFRFFFVCFLHFSSFFFLFFVFLRFLSFFFAFLLTLQGQEQTTAICWKMGNFTPTP